MVLRLRRPAAWRYLALLAALPLAACGRTAPTSSDVLTTHVDHTDVKRQSIGNCWLYAQATWLESMLLTHTGEKLNVSESYWTYWHWYEQIVDSSIDEIGTGGWWWESNRIILDHGFVLEGEFLPDEADAQMSAKQASALAALNTALKEGGALDTAEKRTAANVRKVMDEAWGVDMASAEAKARPAKSTVIARKADKDVTLSAALQGGPEYRWSEVSFPAVYGKDTAVPATTLARRKAIFRRVFKALNDNMPVVMSTMIDFNAMDVEDRGTFKFETLEAAGATGRQGGHMLVLHDYVVKIPGYGVTAEGDLPAEVKEKALDGELVYLVAKNSWGTDRPERGITDGYTRFDNDYLTRQLEWKSEGAETGSWHTTLSDFVLPPGY